MKFNKKWYEDGQEKNIVIDYASEDIPIGLLSTMFDSDTDIARYEEMRMADGRFAVSVKNRANKIILQFKELKNGNTGNTDKG